MAMMDTILLRDPVLNMFIWDNAEINLLEALDARCCQMHAYQSNNAVFKRNWADLRTAMKYFHRHIEKNNISLVNTFHLKYDIHHSRSLSNANSYKCTNNKSMPSKIDYVMRQLKMRSLDKLNTDLDTEPLDAVLHHKEYLRIRNETHSVSTKLYNNRSTIKLVDDSYSDPTAHINNLNTLRSPDTHKSLEMLCKFQDEQQMRKNRQSTNVILKKRYETKRSKPKTN